MGEEDSSKTEGIKKQRFRGTVVSPKSFLTFKGSKTGACEIPTLL
jgi:hypothetical protein